MTTTQDSGQIDANPLAIVHLKLAGERQLKRIHFDELAFAKGEYDPKSSTEETVVMIDPNPDGKMAKFSRDEFIARLTKELFNGKSTVLDFIIQKEHEGLSDRIENFYKRYAIL
ncbi:MAG: hypothetical protein EBU46_00645 [Nitrosomonadaceae bacterium]|nr:hypothetical protein [Nitrosomonadaceae bacterium]